MHSPLEMKSAGRSIGITFAIFVLWNFAISQIPADRAILLNGEGAGQGIFAEVQGYPGPRHVLDMAKDLQLTDSQKKTVQTIFADMQGRAKELGQTIVNIEEEFASAFAQGLVTEKSIRDDSEEIGRLRGKLRAVHLVAHVKTQKILSANQVSLYKKLRVEPKSQKEEKKKP